MHPCSGFVIVQPIRRQGPVGRLISKKNEFPSSNHKTMTFRGCPPRGSAILEYHMTLLNDEFLRMLRAGARFHSPFCSIHGPKSQARGHVFLCCLDRGLPFFAVWAGGGLLFAVWAGWGFGGACFFLLLGRSSLLLLFRRGREFTYLLACSRSLLLAQLHKRPNSIKGTGSP